MNQKYLQTVYENEEDRRLARILSTLIWASWVTYLFVILAGLDYKDWNMIAVTLAGCIFLVAPWVLIRRRQLRAGSLLVVLSALFTVTLIATVGQGIRDLSIAVFPTVFIIAGLTLDRNLFKLCVGLALAAVCWLVFGEINGWFVTKPFMSNWIYLINATLILLVAALAVDLLATNMRKSLELAQSEIAQRKRADEIVRESEAKFRAVVEHSGQGVVFMSAERKINYVSPAYQQLLGFTPEEMVGHFGMEYVYPEDRELTTQKFRELLQTPGGIITVEYRLQCKDGSYCWIETTAANLLDDPHVRSVVLSQRDINERKRAEKALEKSQNLLAETEKIGNVGGWEFNMDTQEQTWTEEVYRIHEVDFSYKPTVNEGINFYEPASRPIIERAVQRAIEQGEPFDVELEIVTAKGNLRAVHAIGKADLERRRVFGFFQDVTERKRAEDALYQSEAKYRQMVETTNEGVIVLDSDTRMTLINQQMATMLGYTIEEMLGQKLESLLFEDDLGDHQAQMQLRSQGQNAVYERCFRRKDGEKLWTLVSATATTDAEGHFDGAFGMVTNITERKQTEERLRESEERYRTLFEKASDGIFYLSADGKMLAVNESFARMHGYSVEEMQGMSLQDLDTPKNIQEMSGRMRRIMAGEIIEFEAEHYHKDGHIVPLAVSTGLISVGGQNIIQAFHRDITEYKRAEEALHAERDFALQILNNMGQGLTVTDKESKFEYVNPAYAQMLGRVPEELLGKSPRDFTVETDRVILEQAGTKRRQGETNTYETHLVHKDGTEIPVTITGVPRRREDEIIGAIAVITNLTERKRAENALKLSEEKFAKAFRMNPSVIVLTRLRDARIIEVNDTFAQVFGYSREEVIGATTLEKELWFDPHDREKLLTQFGNGPSLNNVEVLFKTKDQRVLTCSSSFEALEIEGELHILAVLEDITARKRAEDALRESEAKFRAVVEHSNDGILFGDANATIHYRSPSYNRINGYTDEERVGHSGFETVHPEDTEGVRRYWAKLIQQPEISHKTEYRIRHKDETWRWIETSGQNLLGNPDIHSVVITSRDITARKQAEEALRLSEQTAHRMAEQLQMVNQISVKITAGLDFEQLMQTIHEQCRQIGNTDTFYVALYDDATGIASFPFNYKDGERRANAPRNIRETPGLLGHIIASRKTFYLPDGFNEPADLTPVRQAGLPSRSVIAVPLISNDRVVGVLSMQSHLPNAYSPEQIHTLELLATQVAIAIQNSQLYEQVQNELTERKRAEEAINQRNAELTALNQIGQTISKLAEPSEIFESIFTEIGKILDNRNIYITLYDKQTQYISFEVYVIEGARHYGIKRLLADGVTDYIIRNNVPFLVKQDMAEARRKHGITLRGRPARSFIGVPISINDEVIGVIALQDYERENVYNEHHLELLTTIAAQASSALENARLYSAVQQEEEKFKTLFNTANDAIFTMSRTTFLDCNATTENIFKCSREQIIGHSPIEFSPERQPDGSISSQTALEKIEAAFAGQTQFFEWVHTHLDGTPFYAEVSLNRVFIGGEFILQAIVRDITERKQADEALRESEKRLRQVIDLVPHFIFAKNINGKFILVNAALANVYGTTVKNLIGKSDADFNPNTDEVKHFLAEDRMVIESGMSKPNTEEIITDSKGEKRILATTKIPFTASGTKLPSVLGVSVDITERKRAEEALRENEERFHSLFDNTTIGMYRTTPDGRILLLNPAGVRMLGYDSFEEIAKRNLETEGFEPEYERSQFQEQMKQEEVKVGLESAWKRKDGLTIYVRESATAVKDNHGNIIYYDGTFEDVTVRKQAEEALLASEASYRGLFDTVGEAIYILDRNGRFVDVNLGAANMYGYNREYLIGKTPAAISAPGKNDLALTEQRIQRAFEGEPQQFEFWGIRNNGEIFPKDVRLYKGFYFGQDVVIALARDITDQKMLQERLEEMVAERTQQLQQSEMLSASIINFLPDATLVIDSAGKVIAWNRAIEEMTGVRAADMLGRDHYEYALPFYGVRRALLIDMALQPHPESESRYIDIVRDGDSIFAAIASMVNLQGRQVYLTGKASTLRDAQGNVTGAIESIRDVTAERRAVEAQAVRLRYEAGLANYSRALLESGEDSIIIPAALNHLLLASDASRVYIFENYHDPQLGLCMKMQYEAYAAGIQPQIANDEARFLPYSRMVLLHERMTKQLHYGGLVEDLPPMERAILTPQDIVSLLILPIYVGGIWFGFVGFDDCVHRREWLEEDRRLLQMAAEMLRAYLERKEQEQVIRAHEVYLQNLVTELSAAKAEAEEHSRAAEAANQAKSIFLGNMSHELRTPLNAILGFSELLSRNPNITPSQLESLNTINQSGEHLLEIINDILEITRIETGRGTLKEEDFDFHKLLDSLQHLFQLQARSKNLELHFERAADVPRLVRTDQVKLRQILINLLGNAIKYTEAGQVSLQVDSRQESDTEWLDFAVEDSGAGIAEEEMLLLFTPFDQTASGRESMHGTGLGLAICQAYVKTLGGEISAESQMGRGSIFRFSIPLQRLSHLPVMAENERHFQQVIGLRPDSQAADGGPYRLLVVEDVPANCKLLVRMLLDFGAFPADSGETGCGFEVREAYNGQQAVEIWNSWKPHLIWMDLRMPVMNGLEALQKIHESEQHKQTIIIALTASAFEDDRLQAIAQGFDGYVRKPVRGHEIAEVLESQLGVNFVYAERSDDFADLLQAAAIQNDTITLPPDLSGEWIGEMKRALAQGDLRWMRDLAQQVNAYDPEIGERLSRLIDSFDLDAVAKLLSIKTDS
jgi:PAS domain S-box-containing protein